MTFFSLFISGLTLCFSLLFFPAPVVAQFDEASRDTYNIKIMTYNVQNLFDAEHDRGKRDFDFLPLTHPQKANCKTQVCKSLDWTEQKVELKIRQLTKILGAQGTQPDILVLQEIENDEVAQRLARVLGYSAYVATQSPDLRGIDIAIFYQEKKIKYLNKRFARSGLPFATRDLVNVNFVLPQGQILGVYGNHWPSQINPNSSTHRTVVAKSLRAFVDESVARYQNKYHVVLLGDFNTSVRDNPHPFREVIQNPNWPLRFANVRDMYVKAGGKGLPDGTYFYHRDHMWHEFDRIFVSQNLYDNQGPEVLVHSYRNNTPAFATRPLSNNDKTPVPKEYDHHTTSERLAGYSDHFGVLVKIRIQ